ncbi:hypothetical protein EGM_13218 [Macaca fascicularis]|uniref:Secreted protein n=1 Tax=Macaca fascicularis TaxID=9541 RepID=G7P4F1_MACFA|nr:hypothetical protein EGM_13218 [Macaca fascicularis]
MKPLLNSSILLLQPQLPLLLALNFTFQPGDSWQFPKYAKSSAFFPGPGPGPGHLALSVSPLLLPISLPFWLTSLSHAVNSSWNISLPPVNLLPAHFFSPFKNPLLQRKWQLCEVIEMLVHLIIVASTMHT